MNKRRIRTSILISGRGSNMLSLIEAAKAPDYPAEIIQVVSNIPGALGLERAEELGIPVHTISHRNYKSRASFDKALDNFLRSVNTKLICCAGFMRILTPDFVEGWDGRILNIHPSLLPKYKGLNTHARAIEAGDEYHGCTVHHLTAELDSGQIIAQAKVKLSSDDTAETLAAKVIVEENRIYPDALDMIAMGLLSTEK